MPTFPLKPLNYILGLDLGIASVGWAVVEIDEEENPIRLIDVGARIFERAEVPKNGNSLAAARRQARSARRLCCALGQFNLKRGHAWASWAFDG